MSDTQDSRSVDAVVVGGGPGGCTAAQALGDAGFEVMLLERGGVGRDKACGDMFMPSAVLALKRHGLDVPRLKEVGGVPCSAIEMQGACGPLWRITYPDESLWILPRRLIDQALRDTLSHHVQVRYRTTAKAVEAVNGGWLVRIHNDENEVPDEIFARVVVIAAGARNTLSRKFGLDGLTLPGVAISTYVSSCAIQSPTFEFIQSCRPGYRWMFPVSVDISNVGICALAPSKGSALKVLGQKLLTELSIKTDAQWRGGSGALWSGRAERWHHPSGLLACGDAAGLVDPMTGEGLTSALLSGEEAGRAAVLFLRESPNSQALEKYSRWVKEYFTAAYAPSPIRLAWNQLCCCT